MQSPETGRRKSPLSRLHGAQRPHAPRLNRGKARKLGPILQRPRTVSSYRSAWWWMQSPSNPSQRPNSLLTGKLTGNFAESGLARRFSRAVCQLIQWFAAKFPRQRNREFFEHNREFSAKNREFPPRNAGFRIWSSYGALPRLGRSRAAAVCCSTWDDFGLLARRLGLALRLSFGGPLRFPFGRALRFPFGRALGFLLRPIHLGRVSLRRPGPLRAWSRRQIARHDIGVRRLGRRRVGRAGLRREAVCSPPVACLREVAGSAP